MIAGTPVSRVKLSHQDRPGAGSFTRETRPPDRPNRYRFKTRRHTHSLSDEADLLKTEGLVALTLDPKDSGH